MGEILVKNMFFTLLNKCNLQTGIYDPLKFLISTTAVQSFIRPYVNFCAIYLPYKGCCPLYSSQLSIFEHFDTFKMQIIITVFCPKAGPSLQTQEPRLQFCRKQAFHCKLRNQGCSFTRGWIGAIASRYFPHPTLALASEQTLEDL